MAARIDDKFVALAPDDTRCPDKIRAIAPGARRIYLLRERFGCNHWKHVSDCFHQVTGSFIVTPYPRCSGRRASR